MLIWEMTAKECQAALVRAGFGRLACARDNQPYVAPIYFVYEDQYDNAGEAQHLYLFSTPGQKIEWMRANPHVCLEIDDVKDWGDWTSVVVFGRYEELADAPEHQRAREHAHALLEKRAMWWQPAAVAVAHLAHQIEPHTFTPVYYRIHIDRMTGHRATPDEFGAASVSPLADKENGWLKRFLRSQRRHRNV